MIGARDEADGSGLELLAVADGYLVRPEGREGAGVVFRTAPCALAYLDLRRLEGEAAALGAPGLGGLERTLLDTMLARGRRRLGDLCGRLGDTALPASAIADHERADERRRSPRYH